MFFKLKDLLRFLFIAVFVVLGVGIYYHTNLWPDYEAMWDGGWQNWRIWTILYYPYWQLYAEINLDHLDGSNESNCTSVHSADPSKCPQEDWTVQAIAAIYMLFSNFLLVNLVIAMFSFQPICFDYCLVNNYVIIIRRIGIEMTYIYFIIADG